MRRVIGSADEFYRLRIVSIDASEAPDLQWREDTLWRRPVAEGFSEVVWQRLEAVDLADAETSWTLGDFETSSEAHQAMREVDLDLRGMTKSQFEDAYLHVDISRASLPLTPKRLHTDSVD